VCNDVDKLDTDYSVDKLYTKKICMQCMLYLFTALHTDYFVNKLHK